MSDFKATHFASVSRAAFVVALYLCVAKAIAFAKEAYLAHLMGTSALADAYHIGLTLATWFAVTVVSTISTIWVPLLVRNRTAASAERHEFLRRSNTLMVMFGLFALAVTVALAPVSLSLVVGDEGKASVSGALRFAYFFAPLALLTVQVGYLVARLMAEQHHTYTLTEAVPAIVLIIVLTLATIPLEHRLVLGTLLGALAQLLVLVWLLRACGMPVAGFARPRADRSINGVLVGFLVLLPSQVALGASAPIDQLFAKALGVGEVATLSYASRLISLATGIGAVALTRALLPVLAAMISRDERANADRLAWKWFWVTLTAGVATASVVWLLSDWAVAIAFERGAFSGRDTAAVSSILKVLSWQLPMYFAGLVLVQYLASLRKTGALAAITVAQVTVKLSLNIWLVDELGLTGIALSTVVMYAAALALLCYFTLRNRQEST